MPRALKTYLTNLGFFELAIAAPSMKAALEAWGLQHNMFQQGFAKQTDDPRIVAATMAQPGIVLKRAVGSRSEFRQDAKLPKAMGEIGLPKSAQKKTINPPIAPRQANKMRRAEARAQQKQQKTEAKAEQARVAQRRAVDIARAALETARKKHEATVSAIAQDQKAVDRRADKERQRWDVQQKTLQAAIDKVRA